MNRKHVIPTLFLFLVLASCSTMPQNFGERLAYGYSFNTEIRRSTATAVQRGQVSTEAGQKVLVITDQVRGLLDVAADGDERSLALAIEILEAIEGNVQ